MAAEGGGLHSESEKDIQYPTLHDRNSTLLSFEARLEGPLKSEDPQLIHFMRKHFLKGPSNQRYNITQHKSKYAKVFSWNFIHKKIYQLFQDEPPGFFIEAGAFDGILLSNTLWLEKEKGWQGLLIEADEANYRSLLMVNRKAWTSNSCISTVPYPKISTFVSNSPSNEGDWLQKVEGLLSRSATYESEKGLNLIKSNRRMFQNVQCFPIASYLNAMNISKVDFLSLDIQGGEWEVLKMWPWKKILLRSCVVEYLLSTKQKGELSKDFINFMVSKGYALIGTSYEPDYFFVKKDDPLYIRSTRI